MENSICTNCIYKTEKKCETCYLKNNMESSIARYRKRYEGGHCTYNEMQRLIAWSKKNYESGGRLYAERLAKALTPNPKWYK